jgi:RHS repeat-associated protein
MGAPTSMTVSATCAATPRFSRYRYTGKERDTESGNDYFGARYYASSMGRFMSPDWTAQADPVPWAELGNPQTLNLYAYVGNNPLSRTDPFGHATDPCQGIPNCVSVTADPPPTIQLTSIILGGDGHHFCPRCIFNGASDLAKKFFENWKTGPLPNPGDHQGYSGPHRNYTEEIRKIIAQVEEETGKPISQWGKAEVEKAVEEIREAGGDVKSFLDHIAENNPAAKTVKNAAGWIEEKAAQIQNNPAVQQVEEEGEELIRECESGGCPP